ncbi:MAG: putative lipid II flippase FtsW [Xanthomonadales bacterium]|nr:putative lipid II flippase FtsW [Xanthomonadales bacterium]
MLLFDYPGQAQQPRRGAPKGRHDVQLLLAAIALASLGVVMVASSSIAVAEGRGHGAFYFLDRHLAYLGIGIAACIFIARTELDWLERHSGKLLMLGVGLLLLVFVPGVGARINGAQRWVRMAGFGFQSVEVVKPVLVIYMASYLVRHRERLQQSLFEVLKPLGIAAVLTAMLLAQPDFGSAMLLVAVAVGMVWLGGAPLRHLLLLAAAMLPVLGWLAFSQDYRVKRLTSFLDPWSDPFKDGFQLTQALIAIGRGEWFGVGLGGSVQKLFYLPEAHTDFILAVIAEELGLAGIVLVLALFAWLVGRAFVLGVHALDQGQRFAGYCAFGIALMLALQALVSVGVNLGVLPTKGLTLPLISSGGSSVVMTSVMIGLLLRVAWEVTRCEDAMLRTIAERQLAQVQP